MKNHKVKIDKTISLKDITREVIAKNININKCLDQNFYKKLNFNFTSEMAYCIYYNISPVKCKECEKSSVFMSFTRGYRKYCSKECSNKSKERTEKIIKTSLIKDKNGMNSYDRGVKLMIKTKELKYPNYNKENSDRTHYNLLVNQITRKQPLKELKNIEKRGNTSESYHLDHMFSKYYGFENNIPPYLIGNICNLQMIPRNENIGTKNKKCSISKDELFRKFQLLNHFELKLIL